MVVSYKNEKEKTRKEGDMKTSKRIRRILFWNKRGDECLQIIEVIPGSSK